MLHLNMKFHGKSFLEYPVSSLSHGTQNYLNTYSQNKTQLFARIPYFLIFSLQQSIICLDMIPYSKVILLSHHSETVLACHYLLQQHLLGGFFFLLSAAPLIFQHSLQFCSLIPSNLVQ